MATSTLWSSQLRGNEEAPRRWFASHRRPATGIPEINLGELETGNKITSSKVPNGQPVGEIPVILFVTNVQTMSVPWSRGFGRNAAHQSRKSLVVSKVPCPRVDQFERDQ